VISKLSNDLYDTDLYDKAQECVESTLKFGCLKAFVEDVLPKELRRKSLDQATSDSLFKPLLQRFTSLPLNDRKIKKYREIKQREDKYIKSVTAGRKKKKKLRENNAENNCNAENSNNNYDNNNSNNNSTDSNKYSWYNGSTSDNEMSNGERIVKRQSSFKKLLPRLPKPINENVEYNGTGEETLRRCLSDGEDVIARKPKESRKSKPFIAKQRSASSMLLNFNLLGLALGDQNICDIDKKDRSISPPPPSSPKSGSPYLRSILSSQFRDKEERRQLSTSH